MNMKTVLDNVKETADTAKQVATVLSKQAYSITKAKIAIAAENDKIRKAELELGKLCYKDFAAGADPDLASYAPWCDKITEAKLAIQEYNAVIEEMKAMQLIENKESADSDIDIDIFDVPVEADTAAAETVSEEAEDEITAEEEVPASVPVEETEQQKSE